MLRIMAPAGNRDCMDAALRAGADEVYMGISGFGARRFAKNFSVDAYCEATTEAHRYGVKVNVTLNTLLSDAEMTALSPTLSQLYRAGVDAVIVQDLGFAEMLRENFPDWHVHASTQLSLATPEEAIWAERQGFTRLVLARELSFSEIAKIRRAVRAEIEVFASGALCIACSGKCYLSSFLGGRSGNRGMCTQPCRQKYRNLETGETGFFLSSKDQWQEADEIRRFEEIGVDVIKLEGRMKSPEYVFEAVRYYRSLLDGNARPNRIAKLFNRGYAKGYVYEPDPDFLNPAFSASWGVPLGKVVREGILLTDAVRHGDGVVFLDPQLQKIDGTNVSRIVRSRTGQTVPSAEKGDVVHFDTYVPKGAAWVYKTFDYALNKSLETEIKTTRRYSVVEACLVANVGRPLTLELVWNGKRGMATSQEVPGVSEKFQNTWDSLFDALDRFGQTPFRLDKERTKIVFDANVFVPRSVLNRLRQEAVAQLLETVEAVSRDTSGTVAPWTPPKYIPKTSPPVRACAVRTAAQAEVCRECGVEKIYRLSPPVWFARPEPEPFAFAPLAGSLHDAVMLEEAGTPYALDWMFNVANRRTQAFYEHVFPNAEVIYLSPELSRETVRKLKNGRLGLVVYGHLFGMFTRKTLFTTPQVELENQDGRRFVALRESPTGSRVFYATPMNLTDYLAEQNGFAEIRYDFTLETPEQIRAILAGRAGHPFSYGYTKGIF
ncbi:MAG: U32 family peptidase [Planctomycetia bacterium]|nr:U32 family peptidase [Planctomycetia bacterium]